MSKGISKTRQFGPSLAVISITILVFLVSQFLAGAITGIVGAIFSPQASLSNLLNNSTWAQAVYIVFAEGLAIGLVLRLLKSRGLSLAAIGLRKPKPGDFTKGLVGFAVFYGLMISVSIVATLIFPSLNNTPQDVGFNETLTAGGQVLALLALVALPPLGEEILVRGYLFSGLRSRMSFIKAGLIVSLLFSFAHLQLGEGSAPVWGAALDTFVLSLVLVYLRETTGALYAGMLVHGLNNLIAFLIKFH